MSRWQVNQKTKKRFQWPQKEMSDILHDFEEPTTNENVIIYDQSTSVTDWIQHNIKSLR